MEHKEEVRKIALILQELKDKAPKKYEQIKKEILIKHKEIKLIDTFLRMSKELRE